MSSSLYENTLIPFHTFLHLCNIEANSDSTVNKCLQNILFYIILEGVSVKSNEERGRWSRRVEVVKESLYLTGIYPNTDKGRIGIRETWQTPIS